MLPILESLTQNGVKNLQRGRTPNVIVLAPTRELAKQVSLLGVTNLVDDEVFKLGSPACNVCYQELFDLQTWYPVL